MKYSKLFSIIEVQRCENNTIRTLSFLDLN